MLPKISVIVPVYNVEDYVCACIDSILQQTYQNLEIILVIDGSTDGSERLCRNYKDERIRIVSKENGGLSSARNAGIEVATGAFFSFIDSDDYIDRRMIETLYQDLAAFDADVACCNYDFCDEQSQIIKEHAAAVTATAVYDSAFSGRSSGSPSIRRACITTVSGQALSRQGSFSRKPMI